MKVNYLYQLLIIIIISLSFIITQSCDDKVPNIKLLTTENDSISFWIKHSKDESYTLNKREQFLLKSYQTIKSSKIDTLLVRHLSSIAYQNLKLGDSVRFKNLNEEALIIAEKLKDSFAIGDIHWNYASYYNKTEVYDSAFYHFNLAHTYFDKSGHLYESAKTLYGMAYIKGRFKDYSGSEVLTFKAITKFKKLKNYKSLYSCYNHLALLQNGVQEYDRALFYNNKALEYLNGIKNSEYLKEESLNNIGNIYLKKGDYNKALSYYNKGLENDGLKYQNLNHYARLLDNKAFCRILMRDTVNVVNYLNEALHIRDSLNNRSGIVISKIHLAQYYSLKQDTSQAMDYARTANALAKEIKNSRDYLESLSLLAILDSKQSPEYLKRYIQFSDSLQIVDRKNQNKFTRIAYETDEYIEETERLSKQKIWILVTSLSLISILGLLFFLKIQKSKTEKLRLENEQQKANEQVYLITLKQQEKLEKEKIKERNRIAEELHDGILGKLFGTRVGLGFLDIQGDESMKKKHDLFMVELQTIEKEIREVSHKLSDNSDSSQISFTTIIRQLIENKCVIGKFKYELDFDQHINWQRVNEIIKVNLYRIVQEALQNIIIHASAKNLTVSFKLNDTNLEVMIKDDGLGFKVKKKRKGIGMKNMNSRVEKLKGIFNIYSKPNSGTTIKIQIPV